LSLECDHIRGYEDASVQREKSKPTFPQDIPLQNGELFVSKQVRWVCDTGKTLANWSHASRGKLQSRKNLSLASKEPKFVFMVDFDSA
jgi:hypothetical protein